MELRERYNALYADFAKIDDINLLEKLKLVPAQKHFWSARLIETKNEYYKLLRAKNKIKRALVEDKIKNSPVTVTITKSFLDKVDDDPKLEPMNERIQDVELTIEALKNHYSNITYISQDFKNILEAIRMQNE
tara:strand:- start:176 stop:574 length:399 start_codon:yes stop_codon:yes gene_type:complete